MTDQQNTNFVPASELYCVETSATYPHPDQQATDAEIAAIFDFDTGEQ